MVLTPVLATQVSTESKPRQPRIARPDSIFKTTPPLLYFIKITRAADSTDGSTKHREPNHRNQKEDT